MRDEDLHESLDEIRRRLTRSCLAWLFVLVFGSMLVMPVAGTCGERTVTGWGTVVDPAGDCTLKAGEGTLTITIPAGTHDLNAALGGMKAPRVLREVAGDFTASVKVSGDFDPGTKSAEPNTLAFNAAGLLLWQDDRNYFRLERNAFWADRAGRRACFPPLVEYYRDGRSQNTNPSPTAAEFFKGRSTWLRLQRRGTKVIASYSQDGQQWTVTKEVATTFPQRLQVGVGAVNTAAQPFTVEFADFKVASD